MGRALEAGLDSPAAHFNLGMLLKQTGDIDGARKHLGQAVAHSDLGLGANLALGRLAKMQGEWSEAARYLVQALRLADSLGRSSQSSSSTSVRRIGEQSQGDEGARRIVDNMDFSGRLDAASRAARQQRTQATGASVVPSPMLARRLGPPCKPQPHRRPGRPQPAPGDGGSHFLQRTAPPMAHMHGRHPLRSGRWRQA
jgi:hypothetical protein